MLPDLPKLKTIISKSYVNVRLACRLYSFVSLNLFFKISLVISFHLGNCFKMLHEQTWFSFSRQEMQYVAFDLRKKARVQTSLFIPHYVVLFLLLSSHLQGQKSTGASV